MSHSTNRSVAKLLADLVSSLHDGRGTVLSLKVEPIVVKRADNKIVTTGHRVSLMARIEDKQ